MKEAKAAQIRRKWGVIYYIAQRLGNGDVVG